ncbi:hypothetical protein [Inconstantimicrobium porci]|uniref:hypothetical protein n=1 Tax=Inconstantimicrobium porci TaxID=2652291 RepID=UPI002409FAD3|nr:hypothetical protein [Inconstantimicrobium porci]MDD6770659.1 hypothetical protein [Inconstantimicrobium porci]
MKKKIFSVMLVAALVASLLAGCGKNKKTDVNDTEVKAITEESTETEKVTTVSSDKVNITGELGKGVSLDYTEVSTEAEEYKAVEEYLKDTNSTFEMYDISLLDKDEKKVQPDGMVEVTVKLSDAMKNATGDAYVVFHNQGTDFTKIACTEKDGYVTFKTNHFSIYTVVKYDSTEETTEQKIEEVKEADMTTEKAENTEESKNNENVANEVSNDVIVADNSSNSKNSNNSSDNSNSVSNNTANVETPEQEEPKQEEPVQNKEDNNAGTSDVSQVMGTGSTDNNSQNTAPEETPTEAPTYKNPCPYQLNVLTTYQGHEGYFSNGEGGDDVEIALTKDYWSKGGVTNRVVIYIGEYDDCISPNNPTGVVNFEYFYWTENLE